MPIDTQLILQLLGSFLMGSIPFASVAMWGSGVDIRSLGSGNPGFNNVPSLQQAAFPDRVVRRRRQGIRPGLAFLRSRAIHQFRLALRDGRGLRALLLAMAQAPGRKGHRHVSGCDARCLPGTRGDRLGCVRRGPRGPGVFASSRKAVPTHLS